MFAEDVSEEIDYITNERNQKLLQACFSEKDKKLDIARLNTELQANYGFTLEKGEVEPKPDVKKLGLILSNKLNDILTEKKTLYGEDVFKRMQRTIFLLTIDRLWKNHLNSLDQVRRSINLRAYGQKDPLVEYKKEAYYLFEDLMSKINIETISIIFRLKLDMTYLSKKEDEAQSEVFNITNQELVENRQDLARTISELNRANAKTLEAANRNVTRKQETVVSRKRTVATDYNTLDNWGRIGRNEKCPCGSGKKYKYCCGKLKS